MLYALDYSADTTTHEFIKIDPSTGEFTSLANIGKIITVDFISTTLDACSNRYIISTAGFGTNGNCLYQLDMAGSIEQQNITTTFYQGLEMAY